MNGKFSKHLIRFVKGIFPSTKYVIKLNMRFVGGNFKN